MGEEVLPKQVMKFYPVRRKKIKGALKNYLNRWNEWHDGRNGTYGRELEI